MYASIRSVVAFLVTSVVVTAHAAIAESDFEISVNNPDGFDGWTGWFCPNPGVCVLSRSPLGAKFRHDATDGNPGGWIVAEDPGSSTAARFFAPDKFTDNLNITTSNVVANRRVLSFDAIAIDVHGSGVFDSPTAPVVVLEGADRALVYFAPVPSEGAWTTFSVPMFDDPLDGALNEAWDIVTLAGQADASEADFLNFGPILRLSIIGEWLNDDPDVDLGGLDNVTLSAVPLPAALPLFSFAVAALLGRAARRRAALNGPLGESRR